MVVRLSVHPGVHIFTGSLWIYRVISHALRQWNVGVLRYRVHKKGNWCDTCTKVIKKNMSMDFIFEKCEKQSLLKSDFAWGDAGRTQCQRSLEAACL